MTSASPVVAVATANISETGNWKATYPWPSRKGVPTAGNVLATWPTLTERKKSGMNRVGMVASG